MTGKLSLKAISSELPHLRNKTVTIAGKTRRIVLRPVEAQISKEILTSLPRSANQRRLLAAYLERPPWQRTGVNLAADMGLTLRQTRSLIQSLRKNYLSNGVTYDFPLAVTESSPALWTGRAGQVMKGSVLTPVEHKNLSKWLAGIREGKLDVRGKPPNISRAEWEDVLTRLSRISRRTGIFPRAGVLLRVGKKSARVKPYLHEIAVVYAELEREGRLNYDGIVERLKQRGQIAATVDRKFLSNSLSTLRGLFPGHFMISPKQSWGKGKERFNASLVRNARTR